MRRKTTSVNGVTSVLKDKFCSHKGFNCVLKDIICSQKGIISVLKDESPWNMLDHHDHQTNTLIHQEWPFCLKYREERNNLVEKLLGENNGYTGRDISLVASEKQHKIIVTNDQLPEIFLRASVEKAHG